MGPGERHVYERHEALMAAAKAGKQYFEQHLSEANFAGAEVRVVDELASLRQKVTPEQFQNPSERLRLHIEVLDVRARAYLGFVNTLEAQKQYAKMLEGYRISGLAPSGETTS